MGAPEEVEKNLCKGSKHTFDPNDAKSPEPLPGDIIIFGSIAEHAAIFLGTKSGKHEVISLAGAPDPKLSRKVEKTTIEELLTRTDFMTVKFCTSSW
jgi:hypothetical protein